MKTENLPVVKTGSKNESVTLVQRNLVRFGYDQPVTGYFGSITKANVIAFQRSKGLSADGIVGQATYSKLLATDSTGIDNTVTKAEVELPWVTQALKSIGVHEIKGSKHSPEVLQMWKDAKLGGIKDDETPWCAGATCAWLERAGIKSPRADSAKSFTNWGVGLAEPCYGCIVVFTRSGGGHVGIVVGQDSKGNLLVLGGNQNDSVKVSAFKRDRVSAYRYPDLQSFTLPVCSPVDFSSSEA